MLLSSVQIENYRSIRSVNLEGMSQVNVLVGRNNVGKSTILDALAYVARRVFGRSQTRQWNDVDALLPGGNRSLKPAITLAFEPTVSERQQYFDLLCSLGYSEARRVAVLNSPFLSKVVISLAATGGNPEQYRLQEVQIVGEDGTLFALVSAGTDENQYRVAQHLDTSLREVPRGQLVREFLMNRAGNRGISLNVGAESSLREDPGTWPVAGIVEFFANSFFLHPYRHALGGQTPAARRELASDGANLPVVLNYLSGADTRRFENIKEFMQTALPDLGLLHPELVAVQIQDEEGELALVDAIRISFEGDDNYRIKLEDMGTGVEQLLMVGTVLATQRSKPNIFLEEPENHLHPGAQRFFIDQLLENANQAFLTSHSPVFTDTTRAAVFRVLKQDRGTEVEPATDAAALRTLLDDIGVRNSDVLFADAVMFVEGPSDSDILQLWAKQLGVDFSAKNIVVAETKGGRYAERTAPIRIDALEAVSGHLPVPHVIVVDRDERSQSAVDDLKEKLGDRVHVLERRELENYMLSVPAAIRAALLSKHQQDTAMVASIDGVSDIEMERRITGGR